MRQLTALDQQFLAFEDSRHVGHVGALAVLDPSTAPGGKLTLEDLQALVAERLPLVPPFRWRLVQVPFHLDYDYWIDDADFDLDFHVRELALPPGATELKLAEQVARIFSRPLDRSRPLWEIYLVHGLPEGRAAVMTKIHHAVIDGISGNEIQGALLDLSPEGREAPPPLSDPGDTEPGELEMLARGALGLARYPLRLAGSVPRALPNVGEVPSLAMIPGLRAAGRVAAGVQGALGRRGRIVGQLDLVPPRTSFNGRISAHRRFAFGRLSLAEVKAVKNTYGVTVNDVVVSICAGAVRRWLTEHDELPDGPLVAQIPVSVRTERQQGTYGNRILLMTAPLFVAEADPIRRLALTHEALSEMKERHRALPAELLQDANQFIPPAVFARAARLSFSLSSSSRGRPAWNMVISNVPGPQFPLYMAGARLEANYPISVITDGMGLNITCMSYCGYVDFGLVADRDQMPDLWRVMGWLREALDELRPVGAEPVSPPAGAEAEAPVETEAAPTGVPMAEQFADVGRGITLCYEDFGQASDPPILLIMGLATQMIGWPDDFCRELAGRGFHVVRFDNRDSGRSTHMTAAPPTPAELLRRHIPAGAYTLSDMAADAVGLLRVLEIEPAHIVGVSMGGMIAQMVAAEHPQSVRSLVSIMSTTGNRWRGQPAPGIYPYLLRRAPTEREGYVEYLVRLFGVIGSPGFPRDEERIRDVAARSYDRGHDPTGPGRQLGAIVASGDRTALLRGIDAPTLVIHGTRDKMVRKSGGRATARAIPGARLELIEGMGHDLPQSLWPRLIELISQHARAAEPVTAPAA